MKVVIVGAGGVGRSIAAELIDKGHEIVLVDRSASSERVASVPDAHWVQGDACEISVLADCGLEDAEVTVAATGDDKVNLVVSLLAKTEFGVPRTVARVSHPSNEWMFDSTWGVDVAVSTPRTMTALVEEAVSVGRVVKLFEFAGSATQMVSITVPEGSPKVGRTVGSLRWPAGSVLVGIIRDGRPLAPTPHDGIEAADELLFLAETGHLQQIQSILVPTDDR
ncbi:TrkA family potassium uptake protein [Brachybacterium huguangmaarense]|uniref:Trk system potassium uptake protein TrkA n=1 Tax=Brachybacterium huguangmaarense TaxID=1652028 RepID=A0ABY6FZW1_9MICO|nr:TrkA family potassium uptake protein [Brachybacterium huguangmaarense]UYG16473.1 TrkA family potassium uptake protein [Brachybacterium huguangmaarense]